MSVCLSFYDFILTCVSSCQSFCLSVCLFVCLSASMCVFLSVFLSTYLPFLIHVCLSVFLITCVSSWLSFCLQSVHLSVSKIFSVCVCVCVTQSVILEQCVHYTVLSTYLAFLSSVWLSFWPKKISDFNAGWKPRHEGCGEGGARYWQHLDYWGKQGKMYYI